MRFEGRVVKSVDVDKRAMCRARGASRLPGIAKALAQIRPNVGQWGRASCCNLSPRSN